MIKTHTDAEGVHIKIDGSKALIIYELTRTIVRGIEVIEKQFSGEEEMDYESAFYATIMNTIDRAKELGYELDHKKLGLAIAMAAGAKT